MSSAAAALVASDSTPELYTGLSANSAFGAGYTVGTARIRSTVALISGPASAGSANAASAISFPASFSRGNSPVSGKFGSARPNRNENRAPGWLSTGTCFTTRNLSSTR